MTTHPTPQPTPNADPIEAAGQRPGRDGRHGALVSLTGIGTAAAVAMIGLATVAVTVAMAVLVSVLAAMSGGDPMASRSPMASPPAGAATRAAVTGAASDPDAGARSDTATSDRSVLIAGRWTTTTDSDDGVGSVVDSGTGARSTVGDDPRTAARVSGVIVLAAPASIDQVMTNLRNWLMGILAGLATVCWTVAGARYVLGAGDPSEAERAKSAFRAGAWGYGLAALAPVVVEVLKGIVGV